MQDVDNWGRRSYLANVEKSNASRLRGRMAESNTLLWLHLLTRFVILFLMITSWQRISIAVLVS